MTDKKTDTSQDDRARNQSAILTTPTGKKTPPPEATASKERPASRSVLAPAALVVALIAAGMSGLVWQQSRQVADSQAQLSAQLSAQMAGNQSAADRSASQLQTLSERVEQQDARILALQSQLGEASAVIQSLDEALRSMTDRGSELVLLNDVDHLVTIAQQQLQLGGNVRNAIVAMESAQAQLARANRPALASLQQTLNGDIDRLRAAATIDIAAFSAQLEELTVLLNEAPLVMPDGKVQQEQDDSADSIEREQPAPTVTPARDPDGPWWEQAWDTASSWSRGAWDSLSDDLGQFIEVRRVDDAHALLMSPDQATRFRDNLRTRVMTAQLALMMRQPEVWKTETEAVVKAIESRYDESSSLTRKALRLARGMADASIDARLPTVDSTLQVLASLREEQAARFGGPDYPASHQGDDASAGQPEQADAPQDSDGAPEAGASDETTKSSPEGQESTEPRDQTENASEPADAVPGVSGQMES